MKLHAGASVLLTLSIATLLASGVPIYVAVPTVGAAFAGGAVWCYCIARAELRR